MSDGYRPGGLEQNEATADLAVLGLRPGADDDAIRAAYRRLAVEHHPDRGGSHDVMSRINEAFDRLTSPEPEPKRVAATAPPVWEPQAAPEAEPHRLDGPFASLRAIAGTVGIPIVIAVLVILPAATVVGFIYVVGKILF